jgi:CheY-like chemotaxis protein
MTNIEEQFIEELLFCIKEKDLQKSYALLQFIPTISPSIQNRALFEISKAGDSLSYSMFEYLVRVEIEDDEVRIKLYEIILDKGRVNSEFYFIYIRMAEESKSEDTIPVLLDIITTETNIGILMEAIRALSNIGHASSVMALSEFIYYNDEMLKREAVMALGKIGGSSARKSLEFAAKTSKASPIIFSTLDTLRKAENLPPFQLKAPKKEEQKQKKQGPVSAPKIKEEQKPKKQVPVSVPKINKEQKIPPEKIKDEIEIKIPEDILNHLKMFNSGDVELRHKSIDALIEYGEECIPAVVHNMNVDDVDNVINSLDILGNIGSKAAASPILKVIDSKHKDSNVRFAAFEALERLPKLKSALVLIDGATDPSEQVRIAAASAIDKNLSDVLIAGLRSKIDPGDKVSKMVIEGVIDSKSDNTFEVLLSSDAFTFGFSNYLTHEADPEVRDFFIELLKNRGNRALAGSIAFDTQKDRIKNRQIIFAVDDSRIMLNYYVKIIHKMGNTPAVFTDPNKALEMIKKSKPALVITDLNMLEISGLQFSSQIREIYPKNLLPVVIVTTQGDFVADANQNKTSKSKEHTAKAGVTSVIKKPLETYSLEPILEEGDEETDFTDFLHTLLSELPDVRYDSFKKVLNDAGNNLPFILNDLFGKDIDRTVNILNILSIKGDESCLDSITKIIDSKPKEPALRFAAYNALLNLMPPTYEISEDFIDNIKDPSEHTRIAVAKILNLANSDKITAKLKEMIETGSRVAKVIVAAIIDSRSDKLFKDLLVSDAFTFVASDYLSRRAAQLHRDYFLSILRERGNRSLCRSIERDAEDNPPVYDKTIAVVEESEVMQDYYISKLHTSGFNPLVLSNPGDLLGSIFKSKPDLVITSFFLSQVSGLQMVETIRKDLPSEDLPIVMVTAQSSFVKNSADSDSIYKKNIAPKGVDRIFEKPLKMKDIEVIRSLIS